MIEYENLKSENVENAGEVIRAFSLLLYGNTAGSVTIDELLTKAMEKGRIQKKEPQYVLYTYLTIDGFEKKYYKACGTDLTTNKAKAWVYRKPDLDLYKAYREQYEIEEIEKEEF